MCIKYCGGHTEMGALSGRFLTLLRPKDESINTSAIFIAEFENRRPFDSEYRPA